RPPMTLSAPGPLAVKRPRTAQSPPGAARCEPRATGWCRGRCPRRTPLPRGGHFDRNLLAAAPGRGTIRNWWGTAMPAEREIRADFDRESVVIYQAHSPAIADAALRAQRFVPPFSFHRMTWIKPSFLWLMHRSNWGRKSGQERVLAVRVK